MPLQAGHTRAAAAERKKENGLGKRRWVPCCEPLLTWPGRAFGPCLLSSSRALSHPFEGSPECCQFAQLCLLLWKVFSFIASAVHA
jgi:hypothetical protein